MALELVGGALLSSSLQFLFERLGSKEVLVYLRGKSKKSCDFGELVGKLRNDFNLVLAVIEDAEKKKRKSKSVELWLDNLQDAVFEAEDLLDDINYEAMQQLEKAKSSVGTSKKGTSLRKKFRNVFSRSCGSEEGDMESKVKKILEKFKDIASQKDFLGLEMGVIVEKASWRLPSTCLVDESEVFGRDSDKGEVIKLLLSDDVNSGKLCVISIVGMGGLGKTTLAQLIFNDKKVNMHFQVMAWVCVTEEFDICKTTKAILDEVASDTCDATGLNAIQVKLKERLTGKKFLIVLDDVWHEKATDLELLCLPCKHGAQGSKIIVTTRSEKVALNMLAAHIFRLQTLSDEACWQLFSMKATGVDGDFTGNADLEMIGREIVKKCGGLPLALKTLGGLLRCTLNVNEWKRVLESDIWELQDNDSNILPALKLSYHYLPSQLKRCFAYCSIFPSDYEFEKEELILLWMAENFLESPSKSRRIEDVGDEYFNGLVSRSFFQRSRTLNSKFVMHDLLHDLAKSVSAGYCLLTEEDGKPSHINVKRARHVGYMPKRINPYRSFNNILQALNLRTFLSHGIGTDFYVDRWVSIRAVDDLLLKLRCLRVLSLSGYDNVNQLPELIGELSHLRYLDLSCTSISLLPESVCKLLNLQTFKLKSCWELKKLPKDMHHLIELRHLDLRDCWRLVEMPAQLSELKSLQMLSTFIVGIDSGTKIGKLKELSHLRGEISIVKLENVGNVKDSSDQAKMMDKEHLELLKLHWSRDSDDDSQHAKDVLGMLLPNKALKELHIDGYPGKEFPNWIASKSLSNIVSIRLSACRICLSLPPLGQLPALKSLDIWGFDALVAVGSEFYGDGCSVKPFQSLESLRFHDMKSWETWSLDNSGGFSKLLELAMIKCPKFTGNLPTVCLPRSLKQLRIQDCPELELQFDSRHMSLEQLWLEECCNALISFPLDFFPMLKEVIIQQLKSLTSISMSDDFLLSSLSSFKINGCPSFESFPEVGLVAPSLNKLVMENCKKLKSLPKKRLSLVTSLNKLTISVCPELLSFTEEGLPYSLTALQISFCNRLIASWKNWGLKRLPNLRTFKIEGRNNEVAESFPEEGLLPESITTLSISGFPCVKSLDKNGLRKLTSLVSLSIWGLPELQEIQGEALPNSLESLNIWYCDDLQTIAGALPNSLQDLYIWECAELQTISEECLPTSLEIKNCPKWQTKGLPASLKYLSLGDLTQEMPDLVLPSSLQQLTIYRCPKLSIKDFPSSLQVLSIHECPLLASKYKAEYRNNPCHQII